MWTFRNYKRYFYCNHMTGDTQWDYPQDADVEGESSSTLEPCLRDMIKQPPPPPPPLEEPEDVVVDDTIVPEKVVITGFAPGSPIKIEEKETAVIDEPEPSSVAAKEKHADKKEDLDLSLKPPPPPDEPPPPGTEPPLPPAGTYSLASLAAAPPPPPPPEEEHPTPTSTTYDINHPAHAAELYNPFDGDTEAYELDTQIDNSTTDTAHISAPPVINRSSVQLKESVDQQISEDQQVLKPHVLQSVSQTPDVQDKSGEIAAPVQSHTTHTTHTSHGTTSTKKKKKDKDKDKEKALIGSGLNLKKKKLPSLVEKWQKVQKEVDVD